MVGEHTYGDAAIRKAVTMDDGSAVILSVAKYYSPRGKAIQDTGVTPDVAQSGPIRTLSSMTIRTFPTLAGNYQKSSPDLI